MELVYTRDLKSLAARIGGSTPLFPTIQNNMIFLKILIALLSVIVLVYQLTYAYNKHNDTYRKMYLSGADVFLVVGGIIGMIGFGFTCAHSYYGWMFPLTLYLAYKSYQLAMTSLKE